MADDLAPRLATLLTCSDTGAYDDFDGQAAELLPLAQAQADALTAARVHAAWSLVHYRRNRFADATRQAAAASGVGVGSSCPWTRAEGLVAWARIDWSVGDEADALRGLGEALEPALQHGDARLQLHVQNLLGLVHADLGDIATSLQFHQQARQAARHSGVPDLELVACTNLVGRGLALGEKLQAEGRLQDARARWLDAVNLAEQTESMARRNGLMHGVPHLMAAHGAALMRLGRLDEALAVLRLHRHLTETTPDRSSLVHAAGHLAELWRRHGDTDAARQALEDGLAEAGRLGAKARAAALHLAMSELEESQARFEPALFHHKRFHALREECAIDRAQRKSMALAVRLDTERALHEAEMARRRAQSLADAHEALQARTATLSQEALTDALTGLANRRRLDDELPRMHAEARRLHQPLHVALVDVDHFKQVNDRHSHGVGDAVLREIGRLLRGQCREGDLAARYGGEEFLITFRGADAVASRGACERLRLVVRAHPWQQLRPGLELTVSIGLGDLAQSPDMMAGLQQVDRRLYAAKRGGRDRVCAAG